LKEKALQSTGDIFVTM